MKQLTVLFPYSVKSTIRVIINQLRSQTNHLRSLPDFIIIGTQKGGTTFLYDILSEHPQIRPAIQKEVHYFDNNYHRGLKWYKSYFPWKSELRQDKQAAKTQDRLITGEATPYYMFHPLAPERIEAVVPESKLIAVLRNPIDRAYSHYQMTKGKGIEALSFDDAINAEKERLKEAQLSFSLNKFDRVPQNQYHSYLARGVYIEQLRKFDSFYKQGTLLVLQSESMFLNPQHTLDTVTDFLGLSPYSSNNFRPSNVGNYQQGISSKTRDYLMDYYRPYNEELFQYLGTKYDWS